MPAVKCWVFAGLPNNNFYTSNFKKDFLRKVFFILEHEIDGIDFEEIYLLSNEYFNPCDKYISKDYLWEILDKFIFNNEYFLQDTLCRYIELEKKLVKFSASFVKK